MKKIWRGDFIVSSYWDEKNILVDLFITSQKNRIDGDFLTWVRRMVIREYFASFVFRF